MPSSNSILRRYTPPTCTLEITAKRSPLSRFVGQSVLKDLRFELRFDDPRKPEDQRVTIRGDRTELEMLCDAVNSYVQDFLGKSPVQLPVGLQTPGPTDSTPANQKGGVNIARPASSVNPSKPVAARSSEEEPNDLSSAQTPESNPKLRTLKPLIPTKIYLQPKGLVAHELFLGHLATAESGPVIDLSVLQLFDLATALDEYAAEMVALPNLKSPLSLKKAPPAWAGTAAAVLLAVGVTTAAIKLLDQPNTNQQTASTTAGQTPSPAEPTPSISQVPPAPSTLPSPLSKPVVPPPLSSSPTLAPPSPIPVLPSATPSFPTGSQPSQQNLPSSPPSITIPGSLSRPTPNLAPGGVASLPRLSTQVPGKGSSPSPSSPSPTSSPASPEKSPTAKRTPTASTTPPPLPNLPSLNPSSSSGDPTAQVSPSPGTRSAAPSADASPSESASAANPGNGRLSDTIPQVAQIRKYFQGRWQPPAGLTQTLEYTLVLNGDGTIQRILPLGNAAGTYIDRTDIPLPGEPFVSPVEGGANPTIRLVLTPDGKVDTFLEK